MSKFSVRKPMTIFVAALAILILGVVAYLRMTPNLFPNMDFPYVILITTYPGASPETVETEVSKPLEQSMSTLEDIKSVTSTSSENYSLVVLEFENEVNMDTIGVDIQQNLLALSSQWDEAVGTPYMMKLNPSMLPVEVAAVSMEGMDTIELSDFVDNTLLPKLDGVAGVARISTIGSVRRQIHVVIDPERIDAVNQRLADSVNRQMDEAKEELEDTRAELEEAQTQLEEAQSQLENGKSELISQTAAAEATLNQQTVAAVTGRSELQQQLITLEETSTQLETTLTILRPIRTRLAELEDRQEELDQYVTQLQAAGQALEAADTALLNLTAGTLQEKLQEQHDETESPAEPEEAPPSEDETSEDQPEDSPEDEPTAESRDEDPAEDEVPEESPEDAAEEDDSDEENDW